MKRIFLFSFICILFAVSCTSVQSPAISTRTPMRRNAVTIIPKQTSIVSTEEDDLGGISTIPSKTSIPSTIVSTLTITPTSTPQPLLTEHEWSPEIVLISMHKSLGDGGGGLGDLGPPIFILYADGSLFILNTIKESDGYHVQVLTKKLNRLELCQHINTLDQIGYLDYSPSNYRFVGDKPFVLGASSIFITVNAWKSSFGDYYALSDSLEEAIAYYGQKGFPITAPALLNAYGFLAHYPNDGFELYQPDRLAIWIRPAENDFVDLLPQAQEWQYKDLSLEQLITQANTTIPAINEKLIILKDNTAKSVYAYLGEESLALHIFAQEIQDGTKRYYALSARPLLPYESPGDERDISQIPAPGSPKPNFKLFCHPSDGVLPIPTLPNP